MTCRLVPLSDRAAWDTELAQLPHSYWHSSRAHDAHCRATGEKAFLFVWDTPTSKAACPFVEREWQGTRDIYTPPGFTGFVGVGSVEGCRLAWQERMQAAGYVCGYFALHPEVARPDIHSAVGQVNVLYTLDLSCGFDSILRSCSRSVRRALASWSSGTPRYTTDRARIREFILENYRPFMREVGARPAGMWNQPTLEGMLDDETLLMVGIEDSEGICAAHTFAVEDAYAENHLNISVRDGRRFTTVLVLWGIEQCCMRGCRSLQMGGGLQPGDPIALAKEKFSPAPRPLLVAREIYDEAAFERLRAASPSAKTNFFPPYRA
jgi:hypothetical protein